MQIMQEEQSGLPDTSYEETPLLSGSIRDADIERRLAALRQDPRTGIINTTQMMDTSINPLSKEDRAKQIENVKRLIKSNYPNAKFKDLPIGFSKKRPMDIVVFGPKGGQTKIVLNDGSALQQSFLNLTYVKKALGQQAEQIIEEDRNTAAQQRQRLEEAEKQFMEAQKIAAEREKEAQEIQDLEGKIERTNASIGAIQQEQGTNLESEEEMRRLKLLKKKIIKPNFKIRKKNWPFLKNKQKKLKK